MRRTLEFVCIHLAEPSGLETGSADPNFAIARGENLDRTRKWKAGPHIVVLNPSVLPMHHPICCPDPETAIGMGSQGENRVIDQVLSSWRPGRLEIQPIKPVQPILRPDPEVSVRCLCDRRNTAGQAGIYPRPGGVSILRKSMRWI